MNTTTPSPLTGSEERTAATLAHLAGPISSFVSVGWLAFAGPLIAWFIYRDRSTFVRSQAAEAFNFQVTMWLAVLAGGLLCATALLAPVGVALMLAAALCSIVLGIVGAVRTANGDLYRYPWRIELLH